MKTRLLQLLILLTSCSCSHVISGNYYNHFASSLDLRPDSTFRYDWKFDLMSSWSEGRWKVLRDTVYFTVVPVLDTLRRVNKPDSLVVSLDETPNVINNDYFIQSQLVSGGQLYREPPLKLFFKRNRLYRIVDHKLDKKRKKEHWTQKLFSPWYIKMK